MPINSEFITTALHRLFTEVMQAENAQSTILLFYDIALILKTAGIHNAPDLVLGRDNAATIAAFVGDTLLDQILTTPVNVSPNTPQTPA